ncbi:MAG: alpha-glucosidase [Rhodospirillales bacterium]|nr:alpha-glucosidase [Rhodospirillales bacterium]
MITFARHGTDFTVVWRGGVLLRHTAERPCFAAGSGQPKIAARRGNFTIEDRLERRVLLAEIEIAERPGGWRLTARARAGDAPTLRAEMTIGDDSVFLRFLPADPTVNRLWLRLPAEPGEAVWGGGEQFSYFDLRGRRYRLWASEPGVGRDKTSLITRAADLEGGAGGDYDLTYCPQPTFLSSRGHAVHVSTTAYAAFDFRAPDHHAIELWAVPEAVIFLVANDRVALVRRVAEEFGRPPPLPRWVDQGVVLGLKRGEAHAREKLAIAEAAEVPLAGLWCEDWAGVRQTGLGTRLFWDWKWKGGRYPGLDRLISELRAKGLRFLGYVNPHLAGDGSLFPDAERAGALVRDAAGGTLLIDFGEFSAGFLDLSTAAGGEWFREHVLAPMLALGFDGWMADFGEYLPPEARPGDGADPLLEHNAWPARWAALNHAALAAAGREGDALFFMRAGYSGAQRHCSLLWAGDQCVDFSRHDGLETTITAALSSGLSGYPYHHSDIGGYTSLFGLRRTPEVFMRWAEFAAFTAMMRTHEGNRPTENFQWWEDAGVTRHLARMGRLFRALAPYRRSAVEDGLPLLRPPALHFPNDPALHALHDHAMLGPALLVAPVHAAGAGEWRARLPSGSAWEHLWSGQTFAGGQSAVVPAPLGEPPAFLRAEDPGAALIRAARDGL